MLSVLSALCKSVCDGRQALLGKEEDSDGSENVRTFISTTVGVQGRIYWQDTSGNFLNLCFLSALMFSEKRDGMVRARFFRYTGVGSKIISLMASENHTTAILCVA